MKTDIKVWTLSVVDSSYHEFKTFIASIPEHERETVGQLKAWSAKDEVAHLGFWLETFAKNIKARRDGKPLIETNNYLAMNDKAWEQRKGWTWAKIEERLERAFNDIKKQNKALNLDELTNANVFTLEPKRSSPHPLVKSFLYELIDHPLHHFVKLYRKYDMTTQASATLTRLQKVLEQRGTAAWTTLSRNKIKKHQQRLSS
jgi:Protein of unknown function (DUF1706)